MSTSTRTTVPFVVEGSGTGVAQEIAVVGENAHRFTSDTYPSFGGSDAAPSPLAYALGALTSCNQITAQIVAKDHGLRLGRLAIRATGDLEPSVLATGAEGNSNFDAVTVVASLETDADDETFAAFVEEVERRCPVTQLFRRSGLEFRSTWEAVPLPATA